MDITLFWGASCSTPLFGLDSYAVLPPHIHVSYSLGNVDGGWTRTDYVVAICPTFDDSLFVTCLSLTSARYLVYLSLVQARKMKVLPPHSSAIV